MRATRIARRPSHRADRYAPGALLASSRPCSLRARRPSHRAKRQALRNPRRSFFAPAHFSLDTPIGCLYSRRRCWIDGASLASRQSGKGKRTMSSKTVQANEVRSTGPKWNRWPASLPQIAYVTQDGRRLCVTCANGGFGSRAADEDVIQGHHPDDEAWRVIGAYVSTGDLHEDVCAHCDRAIPASIVCRGNS